MDIEYDSTKNAINRRKHGIDLEDAKPVLVDPHALVREDEDAEREQRFVILGEDAFGRVLVVAYTYRGETIRLISARRATKRERRVYYERRI